MKAALVPLLLVVLPGLAYVVVFEGLSWLCGGEPPRVLRRLRRPWTWLVGRRVVGRFVGLVAAGTEGFERIGILTRRRPEPVPTVLLVLELRRLGAEVLRIEAGCQPHRAARLSAALAAYDSVLVEICTRSAVPTPIGLLPLDPRDRLDLEAGLVASGVDW